ncbi:MAG: universal stress protein [Betaproteobacteria bacterium]|nr:universal stress protein [Betaproteobacteria bacterium]MDH5221828.1 universal stress protein [Betaproteobacteria bacterium]MDH5350559.1 universal stress protein [Betaproteobacteria bacterium]
MKILVAVDGSKGSLDAVQCLVDHADWYRETPEVHLVTVHLPVPQLPRMGLAVGKAQIRKYYEEEGEERLAAAKRKLDAAGIAYVAKVLVGPVAESIVKHARDKRCDLIYIGTRGMTALGKALVGSTATKVLHIADIPVLLVK